MAWLLDQGASMPAQDEPPTNPRDEVPPGTLGTGENICRHSRGTG
jgi:hypothetical protein